MTCKQATPPSTRTQLGVLHAVLDMGWLDSCQLHYFANQRCSFPRLDYFHIDVSLQVARCSIHISCCWSGPLARKSLPSIRMRSPRSLGLGIIHSHHVLECLPPPLPSQSHRWCLLKTYMIWQSSASTASDMAKTFPTLVDGSR